MRGARLQNIRDVGVPIPKLASFSGTLNCQLRNRMNLEHPEKWEPVFGKRSSSNSSEGSRPTGEAGVGKAS
jgi:hypothetical protein